MFEPRTPHHNERKATMLIIHGIGVDPVDTDHQLSGQAGYEVSAHYLVTESGEVRQYLDEGARAWHAGSSYWSGFTDINSLSIGIEVQASPTIQDEKDFPLVSYNPQQVKAVAALAKGITERHRIIPAHILGHQDIAPGRKKDPGRNFDWQTLAEYDVGQWHGLTAMAHDPIITDAARLTAFYINLVTYGYDARPLPERGDSFANAVEAFQTHFLPWNICGKVTEQSVTALEILLAKKLA